MNLNNVICGDIESDGLLDTITKIHVLAYGKDEVKSTGDYSEIKKFFENSDNVVAIHNGLRFDVPAVERVLGIKVKATVIDTLAIAWYVDFGRPWNQYNLEWYGEFFEVPKPEVNDWVGLTYEQYATRCREDVKITIKLWNMLLEKLRRIYDSDEEITRIIKYLNFIMECSYHQERQKIELDIEKTKENLKYFEELKEAKVSQLRQAMPKLPIRRTVSKPKQMYTKKGELSVAGKKWLEVCPADDKEFVEVISGYEDPNPNSVPQKKAWLFSLGWKPQTFKYDRNKETGEVKKIEQIMTEEKTLCQSVVALKHKEPAIELLDGVTVLTHRIGLLRGFLENQKDGFLIQGLNQLAVTLRWQHSTIVNLPKVSGKGDIRDGKWIRECLIAGKGSKIVQTDLSGIESRTSDHYTFHLNPELIKKTQEPNFDPHTNIAVVSSLMTTDEEVWFKWKKTNKERKEQGLPEMPVEAFGSLSSGFVVTDEKALMDRLKLARHKAKQTNYSCLYGVQAETLSLQLGITKSEAQKLIDSYWLVNFAVKEVTKTFTIKKVNDEMWIQNPLSKFWHNLRQKRNAFSTVNQSSATYCFNIWIYNITRQGLWPICQVHDDASFRCDGKEAPKVKLLIEKAMEQTNRQLKLNISLACEVQVGDNASQTH